MNSIEQAPRHYDISDFDIDVFDMSQDFDINAAFQEAIHGIASDTELALEEKIQRMEVIVSEGTSEVYRDFVDFRQMTMQMEMMCNHDHAFSQSVQGNNTLSSFMDSYKTDDSHDHNGISNYTHNDKGDLEYEIDPKTGKKTKKKKRRSWFSMLAKT